MKRMAAVLAVVVMMVGMVSSVVWAQGGRQGGRWQANPEQRKQFLDETASLRQTLWDKQSQLQTLLGNKDSDPAQIGNLEKEIYQTRQQIRQKAQAAGYGCPYGGGPCGGSGGGGRGMRGMGYGMGPCAYGR